MDEQKILCFIDWLGVTVRITDDPRPIPGFVWKEYSATNVWAKRRVLWTEEGDRVCTLLSSPRSSTINAHAGLLEIENEWLYHGGGPDAIMATLLKSVFFEVLGISRLDLAMDFVPTAVQSDIIMGLSEGRYYIGGKRNGSGFWSTNTSEHLHADWRNKKIPHSQSWGHKTSAIKWKLYYKTKELWEAGGWKFAHKPYIIDQWRLNGMQENNVWRLEVSLKHLNDYSIYGRRIGLDVLRENREDLMREFYTSRFCVKVNEGHADKTNDKKIDFLPVDGIGKGIKRMEPMKLAEHSGRITLLRHLVSSLDDEHVLLDSTTRGDVFEHIRKVVKRDNLENYFKAMTGSCLGVFFDAKVKEAENQFNDKRKTNGLVYEDILSSGIVQQKIDVPRRSAVEQMRPNLAFEDSVGVHGDFEASEARKKQLEREAETVRKIVESARKEDGNDRQTRMKLP